MMDGDLSESIKECLDILGENMDVLADLRDDLDDQIEDDLTPDMKLHNLYDMSEDVAQSFRLRRAESNFTRRQTGDPP